MAELFTKNSNIIKDIQPLAVEYYDNNQFYDVPTGWSFYFKDEKSNLSSVPIENIIRIVFLKKTEALECAKIFKTTSRQLSVLKNQNQFLLVFDNYELIPGEIIIKQFNTEVYATIILKKNNEIISKIRPGDVSYEDELNITGKYINETIFFEYFDESNNSKYINQNLIDCLILDDREAALKFAKKFKITKRHITVIHIKNKYQIVFDQMPEVYLGHKIIKEIN